MNIAIRFLTAAVFFGLLGCSEQTPVKHSEVIGTEDKVELKLTIEGMMCMQACGGKIHKELSKAPGVVKASVDYEDGRAENFALVKWDGTLTTPAQIASVVNDIADGKLYKVTDMEIITTKRASGATSKSGEREREAIHMSEYLPVMEFFRFLEKLIVRP